MTTWWFKAAEEMSGCSWHVTQAVRSSLHVQNPAPLFDISSGNSHGKTIVHDTIRTIGVLLKSTQTETFSAKEASGRTVGKPLAAIEELQS